MTLSLKTMCGVFAIIQTRRESRLPEITQIESHLREFLGHRGPDDLGVESRNTPSGFNFIFGHTRLSIIGLGETGHQPMADFQNLSLLTYNGEIYNYRELKEVLEQKGHQFKGRTDSEVLLAAYNEWGTACLGKLVGMFSFVLYDGRKDRFFVARDPFGIKPLYYFRDSERIIFASEIGAIIPFISGKAKLNFQEAYDYLISQKVDVGESTFVRDIMRVLPGECMSIRVAPFEIIKKKFWTIDPNDKIEMSYGEAVTRLQSILFESVDFHLRSDVDLASALSGGVDSSSIVSMVRHLRPQEKIQTFSYIADDPRISEAKWVEIVEKEKNIINHKIHISSEEFLEDIDEVIKLQGEPFNSLSILAQYKVFQKVRSLGITVALDGQGADEIFGGYPHFLGAFLRSKLYSPSVEFVPDFFKMSKNWNQKRLFLDFASGLIPGPLLRFSKGLIGKSIKPDWLDLSGLSGQEVELGFFRFKRNEFTRNHLTEQLARSITERGLPELLRYADRNSMAHSVESRVPFLTTNIADFVLKLPEEYIISREGQTKKILKDAMRGIAPDSILNRMDKIGFETPDYKWFTQNNVWAKSVLSETERIPFLKKKVLDNLWSEISVGNRMFSSEVWRLFNLIRYVQIYDLEC